MPEPRVAFIDESNRHLSEGRYGTLLAAVVSTTVARARRIESGRVKTLWRLLAELERLGVRRLVIESRLERNDRRDRREIERAKQSGLCRSDLVYAHHRPTEGPPLWIADAVAGSASAHIFDRDGDFWEMWTSAGEHIRVSHIEHPDP